MDLQLGIQVLLHSLLVSKFSILLLPLLYWCTTQYLSYRRLSHIPGPRLAAVSNLWLVGAIWRQQSHLEVYEVSKKYGPLARIGPNDLLSTDVDLIHRMQAARSPYIRSNWYRGFRLGPGIDNVLSQTDDKLHTKRRAQLTPGFSGKENIKLETTVDDHVTKLVDLIRRKYVSKKDDRKVMDLAEKIQFFALDTVMDIATGTPFEDLTHDTDKYSYLRSTTASLPAISMVSSVPWAGKFLQSRFIAPLISPTPSEFGIGKVVDIATKTVSSKIATLDKDTKPDMLSSFLRHGITEKEAVFESIVTILGGSDTMSIALRAVLLYTITNPRVYHKLQSEIDTLNCTHDVVTDGEVREVEYLQAVIKESLRIFPPGTGQMPKVVPKGGETIAGYFVPEGTNIGTNPWFIMRSPEHFGSDANVFRPERWIEEPSSSSSPQPQKKDMEYVWELVWGYGKFKCLGQSIALMELGKVLFELLRNFEWEIVDPLKPWTNENVGIWIQKDLNVIVTDRFPEGS